MNKRRQIFLFLGLALAVVVLAILITISRNPPGEDPRGSGEGSPPMATLTGSDEEEQIREFCSACHAFAPPEILPRAFWRKEVEKMYELAGAEEEISGIPPIERTIRYYLSRAPEALPLPDPYAALGPGPLRFERDSYRPRGAPAIPALSYLKHARFLDDQHRDLIMCDMRRGAILIQQLYLPGQPFRIVAKLSSPAHVEVLDLDQDGIRDLVVADLGSYFPADHDRGMVVWLRGRRDGPVEIIPLLRNVGRVADVQAADVDADGDIDLAVAIFGHSSTGKVVLLENQGEQDESGIPRFVEKEIDPRPGAINVPIVDLDRDGRLDIVVLLSQHFETVLAYLNDGEGGFEPKTIYEAPHPDWGSSGIEVVDLDGDGDLDVLLVSGDTLDTGVPKPHHGVQWLENQGTFPFRAHRLAWLLGAHKVRAADLDGDGDIDLAASSFLPRVRDEDAFAESPLISVLWIEQISPGEFQLHPLERNAHDHPALEIGDFDDDGDLDIMTGNLVIPNRSQDPPQVESDVDWLTLFANLGRR